MNAEQLLASFYYRNGVLRYPSAERRKRDGKNYHHGYEIRLVAFDRAELREIRKSLKMAGFEYGRPFMKSHRTIIPIYGKDQVIQFLKIVDASPDDLPESLRQ